MDYNPIYKINFCSKGISANYNILTPLKIGLNNVRCVKKKQRMLVATKNINTRDTG